MDLKKTSRERAIYNKYYKWISCEGIVPSHIIENYKKEVQLLKISYETKTA
jgi:hypothetical protein